MAAYRSAPQSPATSCLRLRASVACLSHTRCQLPSSLPGRVLLSAQAARPGHWLPSPKSACCLAWQPRVLLDTVATCACAAQRTSPGHQLSSSESACCSAWQPRALLDTAATWAHAAQRTRPGHQLSSSESACCLAW